MFRNCLGLQGLELNLGCGIKDSGYFRVGVQGFRFQGFRFQVWVYFGLGLGLRAVGLQVRGLPCGGECFGLLFAEQHMTTSLQLRSCMIGGKHVHSILIFESMNILKSPMHELSKSSDFNANPKSNCHHKMQRCSQVRMQGLGLGLGFRFRVWDLGFHNLRPIASYSPDLAKQASTLADTQGLGFRVQGLGFRIQG